MMSKRNIVNNLDHEFTVEYYVKDDQGKPTLDNKLTIGAGKKEPLDTLVDTCWLKFSVAKRGGCTVNLNGNQVLEQITIKPVSSGGPNTETVVKISAKQGNGDNDSNEDDDVVINTAEETP